MDPVTARPSASAATLPCVLDIEASGFGRGGYPIEIGWVLADGRARCTLVRPAPGWTRWDGEAERVHGITRELVERCGRPPAEVAAMLNADLAGRTVYCDGWAHDYAWLALLYEEAGALPAFRLETVARLLPDDALARLADARSAALARLGLSRHRASNDARALQAAIGRVAPGPPGGAPAREDGVVPAPGGARPPR